MKFSTVITLMATTTSVTAFTAPSAFNRNTRLSAGLLDDVESQIERAVSINFRRRVTIGLSNIYKRNG